MLKGDWLRIAHKYRTSGSAQYAIVSFCFDTLTSLDPERGPDQAGWLGIVPSRSKAGRKEASGGKSIAVASRDLEIELEGPREAWQYPGR